MSSYAIASRGTRRCVYLIRPTLHPVTLSLSLFFLRLTKQQDKQIRLVDGWNCKMEEGVMCPSRWRGLGGRGSGSARRHKETPRPRWTRDFQDGRLLQDGRKADADVDVTAEGSLKRSRTLGSSFRFGERTENGFSRGTPEQETPVSEDGTSDAEAETETEAGRSGSEASEGRETPPPAWLLEAGFGPQELWLTMTRCLSLLRWPLCPSLDSHGQRGASVSQAHPDPDQSAGLESRRGSSTLTNGSRGTLSAGNGKEEAARSSRASTSLPPWRPGSGTAADAAAGCWSSRTRLPRARPASSCSALGEEEEEEEEVFLEVELVGVGEEAGEDFYCAEWRLSERTRELAHARWFPCHPFLD